MFKHYLVVVLLAVSLSPGLHAQQWPLYENTVRSMGQVTDLQSTTISGVLFVTFTIQAFDGNFLRFECPNAEVLACDQIASGDTLLISGHQEDRIHPGCSYDGVENYVVPNVLWKCTNPPNWACTMLVP